MGDQGPGTGWAIATVAVVVTVLVVAAGWLGTAFNAVLEGPEVGPDADEMAEDPVLHVELPDATADGIVARTGNEGGVMPAMANRTSKASRTWTSQTTDWEGLLTAAADAVEAHDVTWFGLRCLGHSVSMHGRKDVEVHDETVDAGLTIYLSDIGSADRPLSLTIELWSDGHPPTSPVGEGRGTPAVEGECPPDLRAAVSASG